MQVQGYCKWQVAYLRIHQRFCWCLQMLAGQYIHILQSPRCVLCHSHSSCVICVNQKLYLQGYVLPETAITGDPEHIEPINPYPPVPSFSEMSMTIWWYLLCTLFLCQLVFSSLFWWSRCNATHLKARPKGGGEQSQPQLLQTLTNLRASEIPEIHVLEDSLWNVLASRPTCCQMLLWDLPPCNVPLEPPSERKSA